MNVAPSWQNGGGQVPLREALPQVLASYSRPSAILPTYPPVAVYSSQALDDTPAFAPDALHAAHRPTIDIPVEHHSHDIAPGQAPTSLATVGGPCNHTDTQMKGRKPAIAAAGTFFGLFSFSQIYQNILFPKLTAPSERADEKPWVASSHSWVDRNVCTWFGFCGLTHLDKTRWTTPKPKGKARKQQESLSSQSHEDYKVDLEDFWTSSSNVRWEDLSKEEQHAREVPSYVTEYAPYIHLFSGEEFWPCDIADHLIHTTPHLNYTPLKATSDHPNLTNLDDLNEWGRFVYLQSDDNVEDRPEWLGGETNIPEVPKDPDTEREDRSKGKFVHAPEGEKSEWWKVGDGDTKDKGGIRPTATTPGLVPTNLPEGEELVEEETWQSELLRRKAMGKKVVGGRSDAPVVLVVVPKEDGVVDAFWFFFYSYNLGNKVFNIRFGNHVGDWEHTVVRFHHGKPKAVFFSEHSFGEAYTFDAVEKIGKRPVGYSATGTHAMYATSGLHPYILPGGILHDETDRGPLWDPLLNVYSYTYNYHNDSLKASNLTPNAPLEWFYFNGHWGDKFYPLSDPRQYRFLGQYHYVNGPLGPRFKNLGRQQICQGNGDCLLKSWVGPKRWTSSVKRWHGVGQGEEMSEEDVKRFVPREPKS
ncbi:vacuolar sorting-associated protein-like protein [Lophiotrema nucula]|uniref:Vacuolar sorting-associated protein-like protein n=1 Tax=Lophiotrema nucula TaxID=690887 RepID=A0A6A5ZAF1_9PLEO|nr:vacuolar sorting-associated protein-like protein [Lophiotrema nucula]